MKRLSAPGGAPYPIACLFCFRSYTITCLFRGRGGAACSCLPRLNRHLRAQASDVALRSAKNNALPFAKLINECSFISSG